MNVRHLNVFFSNYVYFRKTIEVALKNNGQRREPLNIPAGGSGKLYGIAAVPEACPRGNLILIVQELKFVNNIFTAKMILIKFFFFNIKFSFKLNFIFI